MSDSFEKYNVWVFIVCIYILHLLIYIRLTENISVGTWSIDTLLVVKMWHAISGYKNQSFLYSFYHVQNTDTYNQATDLHSQTNNNDCDEDYYEDALQELNNKNKQS